MKKLITAIALLGFYSSASFAGWMSATTVKQIVVEGEDDGSRAYVVMDANHVNGCNGSGYKRIRTDTKKGQYIMSTLLAAQMSGKQVSLNLSGCDDWGRAIVVGVIINK